MPSDGRGDEGRRDRGRGGDSWGGGRRVLEGHQSNGEGQRGELATGTAVVVAEVVSAVAEVASTVAEGSVYELLLTSIHAVTITNIVRY